MAGNIFINYRRGDDPGFTQALFSRLEQAFPPERLFIDVDDIAPGLDFVQVLNDQVSRRDVLAEDDAGRRKAKEQETAEAERLRQERREQSRQRKAKPPGERTGLVSWIAALPSEISWQIPIALVAIFFLGWFLPGPAFVPTEQGGVGWVGIAIPYGFVGLLAIGVVFNARRNVMGGPSLRSIGSHWFAS